MTMAEQSLAMANVVGYRRPFKYVIRGPSRLKRTAAKNPVATLGRLGILPNEVLDIIISKCCDIQTTVTSFSLVNRGARRVIDASLAFQRVFRHAPAALVAMLRTNAASFFTLEVLCDTLCSNSSCGLCGNFGPLLWLPECRRCCMPCLYTAPHLLPISQSTASKAFGVSKAVLASVPTVCTVPGQYGWLHEHHQDIRYLLSFTHARAVAVEDAGGETQFMARISSVPRRRAAYNSFILSQTSKSDSGNVARCMVAASLPYLNIRSGKIVKGRSCAGCEGLVLDDRLWQPDVEVDDDDDFRRYDTVYTIKGLIRHVQTDCPDGRRIWKRHLKKSKQGNIEPVLRTVENSES